MEILGISQRKGAVSREQTQMLSTWVTKQHCWQWLRMLLIRNALLCTSPKDADQQQPWHLMWGTVCPPTTLVSNPKTSGLRTYYRSCKNFFFVVVFSC